MSLNTNITTIENLEPIYRTQNQLQNSTKPESLSVGTTILNNQSQSSTSTLNEVKATAITREEIEAAIAKTLDEQNDMNIIFTVLGASGGLVGVALLVTFVTLDVLCILTAPVNAPLITLGAILLTLGLMGVIFPNIDDPDLIYLEKKMPQFIDFTLEAEDRKKQVLEGHFKSLINPYKANERHKESIIFNIEWRKRMYTDALKIVKSYGPEFEQEIEAEAQKN